MKLEKARRLTIDPAATAFDLMGNTIGEHTIELTETPVPPGRPPAEPMLRTLTEVATLIGSVRKFRLDAVRVLQLLSRDWEAVVQRAGRRLPGAGGGIQEVGARFRLRGFRQPVTAARTAIGLF